MDKTGKGLYLIPCFHISDVEPSGSTDRVTVFRYRVKGLEKTDSESLPKLKSFKRYPGRTNENIILARVQLIL